MILWRRSSDGLRNNGHEDLLKCRFSQKRISDAIGNFSKLPGVFRSAIKMNFSTRKLVLLPGNHINKPGRDRRSCKSLLDCKGLLLRTPRFGP